MNHAVTRSILISSRKAALFIYMNMGLNAFLKCMFSLTILQPQIHTGDWKVAYHRQVDVSKAAYIVKLMLAWQPT